MLLVIPASSLTPNISTLAKDLKRRGSYPEHSLRIISTRADEELAYQIGDELADSFRKVTTETLPTLSESGRQLQEANPRAFQTLLANQMLKVAMRAFEQHEYGKDEVQDAPMLYFHTMYRPSQQGWLNDLQSEFFLKGAPPVMARTLTLGLRTDRKVAVETRRITVGPVIFGRKCLGQLPTLGFLTAREHWRDRMIHELAAGMVETKQIGAGKNGLLKEMQAAKVDA